MRTAPNKSLQPTSLRDAAELERWTTALQLDVSPFACASKAHLQSGMIVEVSDSSPQLRVALRSLFISLLFRKMGVAQRSENHSRLKLRPTVPGRHERRTCVALAVPPSVLEATPCPNAGARSAASSGEPFPLSLLQLWLHTVTPNTRAAALRNHGCGTVERSNHVFGVSLRWSHPMLADDFLRRSHVLLAKLPQRPDGR